MVTIIQGYESTKTYRIIQYNEEKVISKIKKEKAPI